MTIKKLMMAAGAIDEPQVIAPSSNDWDYSFDGGGEWPVAGNTLGDHTIGGYIDNTGGDSAISCLITLDGDFEIEWTATALSASAFGVHALTDDDHRTTGQYLGAKAMTNSFSWIHGGTNPKDFFIGSTAQGDTNDFADGSVIKIERVSGTITIYDDDVSVHVFGTTYSGAMRFWLGAGGAPFAQNYDNLLFTDTEKIQRDGFYGENINTSRSFGGGVAHMMGTRFIATRSGSVTSVKCNVQSVSTGFNTHAEMWLGTSTSPTSQVGSDSSNTQSFSSTGEKTFTFTDVTLTKGQVYWFIVEDDNKASGDVNMKGHTAPIGDGAYEIVTGRHSTITSITDNIPQVMAMEVVVDTSAGEPSPDHEVIFQVQSNDTNGSTSFTDESQAGSAVSAVDGAHHDNGQAKFGTTSIYCDGTDDEITIADNIDYSMPSGQAFTWEWFMYVNGTPANNTHCAGQGTDATANMAYWSRFNNGGTITVASGNGSTARYITCTTNLSNAWHHIAYIHIGGSAGKSYLCIDGTSEGSPIAHTDIVQNVAYPFTFGGGNDSASHVDAWFEGMRLSRTARYDPINGFTPPVARFPSS